MYNIVCLCEEAHRDGTHTPGRIYNNYYYYIPAHRDIIILLYNMCVRRTVVRRWRGVRRLPLFLPPRRKYILHLSEISYFCEWTPPPPPDYFFFSFTIIYIICSPRRVPAYIIISGTRRVCDFRHAVVVVVAPYIHLPIPTSARYII